jgi:hypothetical protein
MASWKKYFSAVPTQARLNQRLQQEMSDGGASSGSSAKYSSFLPEVYSGSPNRIERYQQMESMDLDSEISRALDTIADFSTQNQESSDDPFKIEYHGNLTETEITLLKDSLSQWCSLNRWQQRLWRMFRNTVKYGDQVFVRDPQTFKLIWIDPTKVEKIIVNEAEGKSIEQYVIRDLDINLATLVGTNQLVHDQYSFPGGYPRSSNPASGSGTINYGQPSTPGSRSSRFNNPENSIAVDASHVVHLSLSEGLDNQWPFGTSILESIYKVYKQKDLLEDAIIIYRIVRAPERRVFKIDVGSLQGPRAMQYVERIKNEIYQRRIPNRSGGGQNLLDATYNPISINEDFFLATNSEGKGTSIETLPGGENLGCFSLDTPVRLLDGRDLSIADIAVELSEGKTLWTYSCHPVTGDIAPGKISWAGRTRKDAKVLRITLDSGDTIICTPDHKFPIKGIGFVEAKDLELGISLTALYTRNESIGKHKKNDYTQYWDHISQEWRYTHRMVATFMREHGCSNEMIFNESLATGKKNVIHHIDHNRYNNSPENLVHMTWADHKAYHSYFGFSQEAQKLGSSAAREKLQWLKENEPEKYQDIIDRQVRARKNWHKNASFSQLENIRERQSAARISWFKSLSDKDRTAYSERMARQSKFANQVHRQMLENNPDYRSWVKNQIKEGQLKSKIENPDIWNNRSEKISKANVDRWSSGCMDHVHDNDRYSYTVGMLESMTRHFKNGRVTQASLYLEMKKDTVFLKIWNDANGNKTKSDGFKIHHLNCILATFGLTWDSFRTAHTNICVDGSDSIFAKMLTLVKDSDDQANFVRSSGVSRHNLMKIAKKYGFTDYQMIKAYTNMHNHRVVSIEYLDETMDVGTLTVDGDEEFHDYHTYALSVGVFVKNSIEDLKYFNNKMIRGLGVPSSYLPTGADDGTAVYNDGKVGTAYIQEYRFSKYCQRLQNLMIPSLDHEFKMFLKNRGIEIGSNLFDLQFWPPQSFSEYRQMQIDTEQIGVFANLMQTDAAKYVSKRFALERYLGWTEEEILRNEQLWKEENAKKVKQKIGTSPAEADQVGLGAVGVRPDLGELGGDEGIEGLEPPEAGAEAGGAPEAAPPEGGEAPAAI